MSMSISMKKATTKTNLNHNNRNLSEREKERNSHIDESRSDENKYLVQDDIKKLYEREFGEALQNYNEKQTRSDRKIDNYFKHIEASKKTATQQEMIIQIGEKEDFTSEENRERANEVLEEWFNDFEERNPNLKVYNAVIHNDEASPHLHLNFVPVADDYKRGLEKQVAFDRAIKGQDSTLNKTRPFDDWRKKEVDLLEKLLQERGIERKLVGTNHYKDVNDYKEKKDLKQEINSLEKTLEAKKDELSVFNKKINPKLKVKAKYETKEIEHNFTEKGFMGFNKTVTEIKKERTGNIVLSEPEFQRLLNIALGNEKLKTRTDNILKTDLGKENKKLKEENKVLFEEWDKDIKVIGVLNNEIHELKKENKTLKAHISDLKHEIGNLYKTTKEFIKDSTRDFGAFKNIFNGFVNQVKENFPGSEFERVDEHSKAKLVKFSMDGVRGLDELAKGQKSQKKNRDMDMER